MVFRTMRVTTFAVYYILEIFNPTVGPVYTRSLHKDLDRLHLARDRAAKTAIYPELAISGHKDGGVRVASSTSQPRTPVLRSESACRDT